MQNSRPPLMTVDKFNNAVKVWAGTSRRQMVQNIRSSGKAKGILSRSVTQKVLLSYGIANVARFRFAKHGVYLHYGVGRSHVRKGGSVKRDTTIPAEFKYRDKVFKYTTERIKTRMSRQKYYKSRNRKSLDWFDVVIRNNINLLADVTQEFYGDNTMRDVLDNLDKYLIEKK